jgi:hypothetical protein
MVETRHHQPHTTHKGKVYHHRRNARKGEVERGNDVVVLAVRKRKTSGFTKLGQLLQRYSMVGVSANNEQDTTSKRSAFCKQLMPMIISSPFYRLLRFSHH